MATLIQETVSLRPSLFPVLIKYLRIWFQEPIYKGQSWEEGGEGVLRYASNPKYEVSCCMPSEVTRVASEYFNLTLEHGVLESNYEITSNQSISRNNFCNEEIDIIYMSSILLSKIYAENIDCLEDISITVPTEEIYQLAIVVPKKPYKAAFNFISAIPVSVGILLLLSLSMYCCIHWLSSFQRKKLSLTKSLFYYIQLAFNQTVISKHSALPLFWAFSISFLFLKLLEDQLVTQLTTQPASWPQNLQELWKMRKEFNFVSSGKYYMKNSQRQELRDLAFQTKSIPIDDLLGKMKAIAKGNNVFLGRSSEVNLIADLVRKDRFSILDEKHVMSHEIFYVAKRWRYQARFVNLVQRMIETGFDTFNGRMIGITPYIVRLTHPEIARSLFEVEENQIEFKGVLFLLAGGLLVAFVKGCFEIEF